MTASRRGFVGSVASVVAGLGGVVLADDDEPPPSVDLT